jgi:hypothetical protein
VIKEIDGTRIKIVTQVVTKQGDVNLKAELGLSIADGGDFAAKTAEESLAAFNDMHIGARGDTEKAESGNNEEEVVVSCKQQQKNARKKNKKSKRRETDPAPRTTDSEASPAQPSLSSQPTALAATATDSTTDDRKSCNTCGGFFNTAAAYRSHFKSDWHRFNQKLKLKDVAPIGEEEFLLCDADTFFSNGM